MTLRPLRPHFTLAIYEQGTSTGLTGRDVAPNGSESRFAAPDQIPDIRPFCAPWVFVKAGGRFAKRMETHKFVRTNLLIDPHPL